MNTRQKVNYISFVILLVCLLITALIYIYSGNLVIAILFAPPLIHWVIKRKGKSST